MHRPFCTVDMYKRVVKNLNVNCQWFYSLPECSALQRSCNIFVDFFSLWNFRHLLLRTTLLCDDKLRMTGQVVTLVDVERGLASEREFYVE